MPSTFIPALPKFLTDGPETTSDWLALRRWLLQVRQALLTPTIVAGAANFPTDFPPGQYAEGTIALRGFGSLGEVIYFQVGGAWVPVSGVLSGTQANLPTILGSGDVGIEYQVTDYNHTLIWNGTGWGWAPGDSGSGYMQLFEVDPFPHSGWHLYDGSVVNYLKFDGTLGMITLPDLTSSSSNEAFLVAGAPNDGPNPAVAPTASGGGGSVGTNTTGLTVGATANDSGSGTIVQSGTGTTVAAHTHTHPSSTVTDPGHDHTFTATQPTISATGVPPNIVRKPWFRT